MGLKRSALKIISPYLRDADVLCLSYPDILISAREHPSLPASPHGAWHGMNEPIVDTGAFFEHMQVKSVTYVDVKAWRGPEFPVDLNLPGALAPFEPFDLVIDPGTTEHCFNIGTAMMNAAEAVKDGGAIFHCPPATMMNHGFWNVCPTALWDFYTQNGWEVKDLLFEREDRIFSADPTARYMVSPEMSIYCLAVRKGNEVLRYPQQSKYLKLAEREGK